MEKKYGKIQKEGSGAGRRGDGAVSPPTINPRRYRTGLDGPPLVLVKENNVNNNESSDNVSDDRVVDECNSLKRIARKRARPKNNLGWQKRASLRGGRGRGKKREINTR